MPMFLFIMGCGDSEQNATDLFSLEIKNVQKTYNQDDAVSVEVIGKKGKEVESVAYSIDNGERVSENVISLEGQKMGNRTLHAYIVSEGKTYELSKPILIIPSKNPTIYTYKILETYHHDIKAYTQGLEFFKDTLYESTGQYAHSSLRKTNYKTGEVLQKFDLAGHYFGEGITILNDQIYQLTWREKTGFIYNLSNLEKTGSFAYGQSKEGWGLCNDGKKIYKSDGTQKIWVLNPETLAEEDFIEIFAHKLVIDNVNELEWVDGKIYANIYQKDAIAIVNPHDGAVEGVIDLKGLQDQVTQHTALDVLNGIAYHGEPNMLYVTGKNWDKLFKIEVIKK